MNSKPAKVVVVLTPDMLAQNAANPERPKWVALGNVALRYLKRYVPNAPEGYSKGAHLFLNVKGEAWLRTPVKSLPEGLVPVKDVCLDFGKRFVAYIATTETPVAGALVDENGKVFVLVRCPSGDSPHVVGYVEPEPKK